MAIEGYIVRLLRESEQRPGQVTLAGTVKGDTRERFGHFWIELTAEDYDKALTSHRANRAVTVQGDIIRRGTRRWLENARDFAVLKTPG